MAVLEIALRFAVDGGHSGEAGQVIVTAAESCTCRQLVLLWQAADEEGRAGARPARKQVLARWAAWEAGGSYTYPFELDGAGKAGGRPDQGWLVMPEAHLAGVFEAERPLPWTRLPETASPAAGAPEPAPTGLEDPGVEPAEVTPAARAGPSEAQVIEPAQVRVSSSGPPCTLSILFEQGHPRFTAGSTVKGQLIVTAHRECRDRSLTLDRWWRTHGKGNKDSGGNEIIVVAQDVTWQPGRQYGYPFSFLAPTSPVTYHGRYINVDWYLKAAAQSAKRVWIPGRWVRWAPSLETEFLVEPAAGGHQFAPQRFEERLNWFLPLLPILLLLFGLAAWLLEGGFWLGAILVGIAVFITYREAANFMAMLRLGNVRVEISDLSDENGIAVQVQITPRKDLGQVAADAYLKIKERATEGSGSTRKTHTAQVDSFASRTVSVDHLRVGMPAELSCTLKVPTTLPPPLKLNDNEIAWDCRITIIPDVGPKWSKERRIKMRTQREWE